MSVLKAANQPGLAISIGGHALPTAAETQHILICGTTGTGKSTIIEEVLSVARQRGNRLVICDPAGGFMSRFARTGDRVLNPFDRRSPGWSLFNEMRADYDAERLARAVVPDGAGESAAWHHYARVLLAAVVRALIRSGRADTTSLVGACTVATAAELGPLLAGTPAAGLCDPDASRALASTRFVLATHLAPHAFIAPGSFSLRRWVREASGALFLTWRSDMQAAVAPLIATWVGICANEILSLEPEACRRVWLLIDELAALGAIPALDEALTLGRKYGLCVVSGLQSTAQLDHLYGRERATTLRACFRTLAVLGISRTDPDTSEFLSRALGDREMVCNEESRALGDAGHTRSVAARRIVERTVLASEIAGLPDLTGYLAIAGSGALLPLQLKPAVRSRVIEPFEERPS